MPGHTSWARSIPITPSESQKPPTMIARPNDDGFATIATLKNSPLHASSTNANVRTAQPIGRAGVSSRVGRQATNSPSSLTIITGPARRIASTNSASIRRSDLACHKCRPANTRATAAVAHGPARCAGPTIQPKATRSQTRSKILARPRYSWMATSVSGLGARARHSNGGESHRCGHQ